MNLNEFEIGNNPVQCGCCDYYSLAQRGKCLVCPVCFWEDDYSCVTESQLNLDLKSDLNDNFTLREARKNFQRYGAWKEDWKDVVIKRNERELLTYEHRSI